MSSRTRADRYADKRQCEIHVCTYDRKERGVLFLENCKIEAFLKKADAILRVHTHQVVLEENGMLVNDNNFAELHEEPLMLLQHGEKWFDSDTRMMLKYITGFCGGRLISLCNHNRERKTILKVPHEIDYGSFIALASRHLGVNGVAVALEDSGVLVNDLDILNAREKVLMVLEGHQQWYQR